MTPCVIPCARPLHTPPLDATMHTPSHMRDSARLAPEGGACRGRAHMQWGRGGASLQCPRFSCHPRVVHGPNEAHGVGEKGEGRGSPRRAFAWHPLHTKGGRGACDVAPILVAPPILLRMRTSPNPRPNGGCCLLPTLFAQAGRGRSSSGGGHCAHCAVRVSGAKGGGHTFAWCSAFPICTQRQGGANPMHERGRAPLLSLCVKEGGYQGGAHRRGPCSKRGWGMQTVCLHPPSLLHTCSPAMLHTE